MSAINPRFPRFKKVELSDRKVIERITGRFPPYSDYSFVSMLSWNISDTVAWSVLRDNLAVRFDGYLVGQGPFYSLLGEKDLDLAIADLLALARQLSVEGALQLVPEIVVDGLSRRGGYLIEEDPDNHDYVFRIADIADCHGAPFESKRKRINRFRRSHGEETRVVRLDLTDTKTRDETLEAFRAWEQSKALKRERTREELAALAALLRNAPALELFAVGVVVQGRLRAFSICEVLGDFAIGHFEKADVSYAGLPQYLKQVVASCLRDRGCVYINYEQDLGLPGIRREKRSWRPAMYLKKFVISAAPEL